MILDLIKNYNQEVTTVASFSVGTFTLDCQLEESHESNLVTTENPMESGAKSSDHSYLEPKRYAVRGILVSYEPFNVVRDVVGTQRYDYVKSLPLPLGVQASLGQAVGRVNATASTVLNTARKLAPWMPDSLGWLGDQAKTANRFEKIYSDLLSIQRSEEFLTVTSALMTYNNMQLVNVVASRGTDDAVELTLTFKETHVVETRTVKGLVVNVPTPTASSGTASDTAPTAPEAPKTGRSAEQSAKAVSRGRTTPVKQEPKKSVLASIFGGK